MQALKNAKSCALVCVDEQVKLIETTLNGWCDWDLMSFFESVVDEIEKFEERSYQVLEPNTTKELSEIIEKTTGPIAISYELLDERQLAMRNAAYVVAYRWMSTFAIILKSSAAI